MPIGKLLSPLTTKREEQSNILRMLLRGTCYTASITLASVPVLQVFALTYGIDEARLGVVRLFMQTGSMLGYLLFMKQVNRIPTANLVRKNFLAHLALIVLPGAMLLLALVAPTLSPNVFMLCFTAGYTASGFLMARHLMIYTRVESRLFASPIYGKAFGIAGIVYYLLGMVLGLGVKGALTLNAGFLLIFSASLLLAFVGFIASRGFLLVKTDPPPTPEKTVVANTYPRRKIILIVIMHVFRGVMAGIAFFFVPVALKKFGLLASDAGYVSLLLSAGYLAGYLFIFRKFDGIGPAKTTLLGAALQILPLLLLVLTPGRATFFVFYFIFSLGDILIAQGVPLGILQIVPSTSIGSVTALRLVALQAVDALTSLGIGAYTVAHFALFATLYCVLALLVALLAHMTLAKPPETGSK